MVFFESSQLGVKFRRQHSIKRYIVDFFCKEIKLAIEIDGNSHFKEDSKSSDAVRDDYLNGLGIRVLRFTNSDIMQNLEVVLSSIRSAINSRKFD
ncbi:endonuclease domain-containing protein [Vibrio maerlii]|uniref:endonuclease domain-containing protein n=1 Tax=Vibrio maerlii TaxID=2231648 RepID=UPI0030B8C8CE